MRIAILDDYQRVALTSADWTPLAGRAEITVFDDHLADPDALAVRLAPFDIICVMRERTLISRGLLERLPELKLICSTAPQNAAIDVQAAAEMGIQIAATDYSADAAIELTWALILAAARHLVSETEALRDGRWQESLGIGLRGRTLGVLGLGHIGAAVARIGQAFGMKTIAWSQNLTPEQASEHGVTWVSREDLLARSDVLSVHLVLSARSRGLIDAAALAAMKPTAWLVNTARGPIVDEPALIAALKAGQIAGAALDVFDVEPLPADHPFRRLPNVLATPHIGYVADTLYATFYGDTVDNILAFVDQTDAV